MNICVFCSAQQVPEKYNDAARMTGSLIAKGGHTLVWGASDRGCMKILADTAQQGGARTLGISMELLKGRARKQIDELIVAKDLGGRKGLMLERSDAFVALAGGIGTLDEVTEIVALRRHGLHHKPIVFLDTDNFYKGTREQFETMEREGFFKDADAGSVVGIGNLVHFAATPEEAMRYIEDHGN
ncbi:TIGR00730 family Rossman fold protein [Candidatus Kaiserbacteria bacterium]|nr:TIGR00730 family Rossman fold protein [Candidatus Kaiserbacteria bacterium]